MSNPSPMQEAGLQLYRHGQQVMAIIRLGDKRGLGFGEDVGSAITAAFLDADPSLKGVKVGPSAAWSFPRIEDLPEAPEGIQA